MPQNLKYVGITALVLTITILALAEILLYLRAGPRAAMPAEDPVVKWNRERDALPVNAEWAYTASVSMLLAHASEDWEPFGRIADNAISPEVAAWLDENDGVFQQIRTACDLDTCRFQARWEDNSLYFEPRSGSLRAIAKFVALRSRLAEERCDIAAFGECMRMLDAISRHAMQQPTIINNLVGVACYSLMSEQCVRPFGWDVDPLVTAQYSRTLSFLDRPLPPIRYALQTGRDMMCWEMKSTLTSNYLRQAITPESRIAGEIDRLFEPLMQIGDETLEYRLDRTRLLWRELNAALSDEHVSKWNTGKMCILIVGPSTMRFVEINSRAFVMQRGVRTVRAIFDRAGPAHDFPETLDFLCGEDFVIDGYTGRNFIYRKTKDGFTLYSTGVDRDDDGGVHDPRWGEKSNKAGESLPPDGDFVFWPNPPAMAEPDGG